MSSTDSEIGMRNLRDKASYERLEKDVAAVKNDIAALTDQITGALSSFAGTARTQARRGYTQARANRHTSAASGSPHLRASAPAATQPPSDTHTTASGHDAVTLAHPPPASN